MENLTVNYTKEESADDLFLGSTGSAGTDICANESGIILCGTTKLISTGMRFEIPKGKFMMIVPRSGLALKSFTEIPNSPGIVDSDYRGEVKVILFNNYPLAFFQGLITTMSISLVVFMFLLIYLIASYSSSLILSTLECLTAVIMSYLFHRGLVKYYATKFGFVYNKGDRLAQIIILDYNQVNFNLVTELTPTDRGVGGFGSTGVNSKT